MGVWVDGIPNLSCGRILAPPTMEMTDAGGKMASSVATAVAPTATGGNGPSAIIAGNIAVLKRMLVDDDDDSSSSDDDAPKPEKKASSPTKPEEDAAAVAKPKLQRRGSGEKKKPADKVKKKEAEPRAEKARKEPKKPTKSTAETDVAPLKVRSERLQMREVLKESTGDAAVEESSVKAVAPRKRPRSGEKDAKEAAPVEDKQAKAKRPRLTRQESREQLDEEKRQREAEKAEAAKKRRDRIERRGSKTSDDGEKVKEEEKEKDVAVTTVEESVPEDINAKPKRPRKEKLKPHIDEVELSKVEEPKVHEPIIVTPRRTRAISTDDSDEEEILSKPESLKSGDHKRPVKPSDTVTREDGDEKRERKRLKRPLSATSNGSAKKLSSLARLLDRESGVNGEKAAKHNTSPPRAKEDEKRRLKPSRDQELKPLKRRVDKPRSLDEFLDTERDARGIKSKPRKPERVREDAASLDDFLKATETKPVVKKFKPERSVEAREIRQEKHEGEESSSSGRRVSDEPRVSIPDHLPSESEENSGDVSGNHDVQKALEPETTKKEKCDDEIDPPTVTKDASPAASAPEKKKEEPADEKDGAVPETEPAVEEDKPAKVPDMARVEEPAAAVDPMSFVIPKKRHVSTAGNNEANRSFANGTSATRQATPVPQASPVSSVESTPVAAAAPKPRRSKNAVPPRLAPITPREKEFLRLTKKSNSLFKAASMITVQATSRGAKLQPRLVSAFGCTTDRYGVLEAPNVLFSEATTRMACPTRTQIKSAKHPPAYFGVSMATPPLVAGSETQESAVEEPVKKTIPCYETLEFERSDDRDWYQQFMYGTPFVPQLLRERVTLVMHNARYERKATGMHFNAQRDKELYCEGLAQRYTMNRSVPRCDILARNWQQLANGRPSFVFLHYMNREDAEQARQVFKDDEGQPLTFKNETRRMAGANGSASPAPGRSPPPMPSPPPPRRRSPSPHQGRYRDRGPWPPRDHNLEFRDDRGRRPFDGAPPLPPRSPPMRQRGRSRSRSRSQRRAPPHHDFARQSRELERGPGFEEHREKERAEVEEPERVNVEEKSLHSSQATTATHDSSMDGEEGQILSQNEHSVDGERRGDQPSQSSSGQSRSRSRSRSRPRFREMHDQHRDPSHQRSRSPQGSQRGYDDRSFQQRDRRGSREFYGRDNGGRRGSFGNGPPPQDWLDRDRERDRYGPPGTRPDRYDEQQFAHGHHHHRDQHAFHDNHDNRDYRAPQGHDDRRGRHGSDDFRRQHDHRDHRERNDRGGRY